MENFLFELEKIIKQRLKELPEDSYTAKLFKAGSRKIGAKVMEEATEVVSAYLSEGKNRVLEESADLLYHLLVLLASAGASLEEVVELLKSRHR